MAIFGLRPCRTGLGTNRQSKVNQKKGRCLYHEKGVAVYALRLFSSKLCAKATGIVAFHVHVIETELDFELTPSQVAQKQNSASAAGRVHARALRASQNVAVAIAASLRAARIKSLGGGLSTLPCKGIFKRLTHAIDEDPTADDVTKRSLCGTTAYFMADQSSTDASDTMDGALCSTVLDLARALLDVATFSWADLHRQFSAPEGVLRPVEARTKKAHSQYVAHARVLGRKIHHTLSGVAGPIEAKLFEFRALGLGHAYEAFGLVVGAFGELSAAFYELVNATSRA
jgi:hypothetical protein